MAREQIAEILYSRPSLYYRAEPVSELGHYRDQKSQEERKDRIRNDTYSDLINSINNEAAIYRYADGTEYRTADTAFPCLLGRDMRHDLVLAQSDTGKVSKSISSPGSEKAYNHVIPAMGDKKKSAYKTEQRE